MKAFLLAGGNGTRLRPLTDSIPKCLVPIRGRPLLDIWLELCARSGITDVLINLHAHPQRIEQHLAQTRPAVNVRLIREESLLGSAGTIAANREWIAADHAFWILYSDVLTNMDLRRMGEFHGRHEDIATLGLYQVPDPSRCGVALTDEAEAITEFEEKPQNPRGNWVFSGIMAASPQLFDFIPSSVPSDISFDVLPRLLGKIRAYRIHDYLVDIGTLANYQKAQTSWPGNAGLAARPSAALRPLDIESLSACNSTGEPS
jgi:mannose-1-phosphate guanylyltransferase